MNKNFFFTRHKFSTDAFDKEITLFFLVERYELFYELAVKTKLYQGEPCTTLNKTFDQTWKIICNNSFQSCYYKKLYSKLYSNLKLAKKLYKNKKIIWKIYENSQGFHIIK